VVSGTPPSSDPEQESSSDTDDASDAERDTDEDTPVRRTPPSHITKAGRPVRPPNRYSPS
jgi:hypothetical protein